MKPFAKHITVLVSAIIFTLSAAGCAGTKDAIESRKLTTSVKMSDTIFLEPVEPEERIVWIRVRNTSDRQDLDPSAIESIIKAKMEKRGYKVTDSPKEARYRLQANVLYANHERKGLTEEGMLIGGFGGGALGSTVRGGGTSKAAATVGGALLGAVIGGIAGSAIHVDKYMLVVDIQISEKAAGSVETETSAESTEGSVTKKEVTSGSSDYLKYRTRIVGTAKKTNLKWEEAKPVLMEGLAASLAGIF